MNSVIRFTSEEGRVDDGTIGFFKLTELCRNCGREYCEHGFGMGNQNDKVGECDMKPSRVVKKIKSLSLSASYSEDFDEYVVAGYHTDDAEDALMTAFYMVAERSTRALRS